MKPLTVIITVDCETPEDIKAIQLSLGSISPVKSKKELDLIIAGYFCDQYRNRLDQISTPGIRIIPFPRTNATGYLKLCLKEREFKDEEWIVILKSGDLLLENGLNILNDEFDGHVGTHYLGMGKDRQPLPKAADQDINSIYSFIEVHQEEIICEPGLSGTAIKARHLRNFFEFYEPNESHLLQFVERLDAVQFLTSPIVYRRPAISKSIECEYFEESKTLTPLEKIQLTDELINRLDRITEWTARLKEAHNEMIIAYKLGKSTDIPIRTKMLELINEEIGGVYEILGENELE